MAFNNKVSNGKCMDIESIAKRQLSSKIFINVGELKNISNYFYLPSL